MKFHEDAKDICSFARAGLDEEPERNWVWSMKSIQAGLGRPKRKDILEGESGAVFSRCS